MSRFTRRHLLKAGLAASAGVVTAKADILPEISGRQEQPADAGSTAKQATANAASGSGTSLRERLLLDFGWRFHLGNADDPLKDFSWGELRRAGTFAQKDLFLPLASPTFDERGWQRVDLPPDISLLHI